MYTNFAPEREGFRWNSIVRILIEVEYISEGTNNLDTSYLPSSCKTYVVIIANVIQVVAILFKWLLYL